MNLLFSLCSEVFFLLWRVASKFSVQIGEILEGVPMGEPKVGTGVMGDTKHLLLTACPSAREMNSCRLVSVPEIGPDPLIVHRTSSARRRKKSPACAQL
jgi:hypothetical protein